VKVQLASYLEEPKFARSAAAWSAVDVDEGGGTTLIVLMVVVNVEVTVELIVVPFETVTAWVTVTG
jgi:hypothetical protein